MRAQKTVLILGAGASKCFGLPLGEDLKSLVARDLRILFDDFETRLASGSPEIVEALRYLVRDPQSGRQGDINPHRAVAVRIAQSMGPSGSIDEYVERHRDDSKYADCAKLAIAKAILDAERRSTLYSDHRREGEDLVGKNAQSWLSMMLRDITRRLSRNEISGAFDNLLVINFNYDRCFEHFSFLWLKQMYGLDDNEAAKICSKLAIYHPYGKIGELPHENPSKHIVFGGELSGNRLVSISSNIRTYSEPALKKDELNSARSALSEAKKIVFLGFGFHEQNMNVLALPDGMERTTLRCYATTMGVSAPRMELDKESIATSFRVSHAGGLFFEHVPDTCENFWHQYGDVVSN